MLKKLFSGKIGRLRFLGSLALSFFVFIAIGLGGALTASSLPEGTLSYGGAVILYAVVLLFIIGMTLVIFSLYAKRCHDLGLSGWYSLLMVVPMVNFIFLFYLLFVPGKIGANQY